MRYHPQTVAVDKSLQSCGKRRWHSDLRTTQDCGERGILRRNSAAIDSGRKEPSVPLEGKRLEVEIIRVQVIKSDRTKSFSDEDQNGDERCTWVRKGLSEYHEGKYHEGKQHEGKQQSSKGSRYS